MVNAHSTSATELESGPLGRGRPRCHMLFWIAVPGTGEIALGAPVE
jgi:hypothetical protein